MSATHIPPARLVQLRADGIAADRAAGHFVDPSIISAALRVLDRRGEAWGASVLGRDISRRSITHRNRPWLRTGEDRALLAADTEEDRVAAVILDPDAHR